MVVILTLRPPKANLWYLAYGSNLSASKFTKDRGIVPINSAVVRVPGFTLTMTTAGVPYQEPSFASIRRLPFGIREAGFPAGKPCASRMGEDGRATLLGTAYLVTREQYKHIISSEGGGIAYQEAEVWVECHGRSSETLLKTNAREALVTHPVKFLARTLVTVTPRHPEPRPSHRYMNLILNGAAESSYPEQYQLHLKSLPCYEPPRTVRRRVGAKLFLAFWLPIFAVMEKITMCSIEWKRDDRGVAPWAIILLVRSVMKLMWWYHDYMHAPLWGRGDGRNTTEDMCLNKELVFVEF